MMPVKPSLSGQDRSPGVEMDDIDTYIAHLTAEERDAVVAAGAAIDIAVLLYRARERRGLTQTEAARLAGLRQQTVSRLERPDANPQLGTIQSYLAALGYAVEMKAIDLKTGEMAADIHLTPSPARDGARRVK